MVVVLYHEVCRELPYTLADKRSMARQRGREDGLTPTPRTLCSPLTAKDQRTLRAGRLAGWAFCFLAAGKVAGTGGREHSLLGLEGFWENPGFPCALGEFQDQGPMFLDGSPGWHSVPSEPWAPGRGLFTGSIVSDPRSWQRAATCTRGPGADFPWSQQIGDGWHPSLLPSCLSCPWEGASGLSTAPITLHCSAEQVRAGGRWSHEQAQKSDDVPKGPWLPG